MTELTHRQENFAHDVASGMAIAEAYRRHYSTPRSTNALYVSATRLARHPKVMLRIKELQAQKEERENYTVELARCKLLDVYESALESRHYNAAISALTEINRISGLHVQKLEVSGEITHRDERLMSFSTEELRAFVMAKRAQLEAGTVEADYQELDTEGIKIAGNRNGGEDS